MPMLTANANAKPNAYHCPRLHRLGELQAHLKFLRNFVSSYSYGANEPLRTDRQIHIPSLTFIHYTLINTQISITNLLLQSLQ